MPKGARLSGDAGCVALRPNGLDSEASRALDGEGARTNQIPRPGGNRAGFPSQDRLVEPENLTRLERPVRDELVTWSEPYEIADDELLDLDASLVAVANNSGRRRDERGEPVESALRPDLLDDPDRRVRDEDSKEERIAPVAEHEGDDAEDEQDEVEDREDIGANDARVGAARCGRREWFALREQAGGIDLGKAARHRPLLPVQGARRSRDECLGSWSAADDQHRASRPVCDPLTHASERGKAVKATASDDEQVGVCRCVEKRVERLPIVPFEAGNASEARRGCTGLPPVAASNAHRNPEPLAELTGRFERKKRSCSSRRLRPRSRRGMRSGRPGRARAVPRTALRAGASSRSFRGGCPPIGCCRGCPAPRAWPARVRSRCSKPRAGLPSIEARTGRLRRVPVRARVRAGRLTRSPRAGARAAAAAVDRQAELGHADKVQASVRRVGDARPVGAPRAPPSIRRSRRQLDRRWLPAVADYAP